MNTQKPRHACVYLSLTHCACLGRSLVLHLPQFPSVCVEDFELSEIPLVLENDSP